MANNIALFIFGVPGKINNLHCLETQLCVWCPLASLLYLLEQSPCLIIKWCLYIIKQDQLPTVRFPLWLEEKCLWSGPKCMLFWIVPNYLPLKVFLVYITVVDCGREEKQCGKFSFSLLMRRGIQKYWCHKSPKTSEMFYSVHYNVVTLPLEMLLS